MGGGPRRELAENEKRYSELSAGIRNPHTGQNIVTCSPDRQRARDDLIRCAGDNASNFYTRNERQFHQKGYIHGATLEIWARTNKMPIRKMTAATGSSHRFFRWDKNSKSWPMMDERFASWLNRFMRLAFRDGSCPRTTRPIRSCETRVARPRG
jgi:hypothetical protein